MALHKHQCGDCSHIFEHDVPNTKGMPEKEAQRFYDDGHNCPVCHTGPWKDRYFSDDADRNQFISADMRERGAPEEVVNAVLRLMGLA